MKKVIEFFRNSITFFYGLADKDIIDTKNPPFGLHVRKRFGLDCLIDQWKLIGGMHMQRANNARNAKKAVKLHIVLTILAILFIAIITISAWQAERAEASEPSITVQEIDYDNSTITIKSNAGDSAIYFSDSKGKNWETIPGEIGSDRMITMDISWIPNSTKYTLQFKGNVATDVITVNLPKQVTNFKATYNRVKGTISFTNQGSRVVEWRKKDSYIWNSVSIDTFPRELEMLSTQGATVYLRLASVTGNTLRGTVNAGERPSKEVAITIPKKTQAPSIIINGSKFFIPVTKNLAYRVVLEDGTTTEWQTITSATNLMLSNVAASALYSDETTTSKEVVLQFRRNATSSAQVSHITSVTVPVQEGAPKVEENGISISYTSSTSLTLTIKAASATRPFEYTIVKPNAKFNYQDLTWSSITSSAAVTIAESKAPKGSHIYVRKASQSANGDVKFSLASKEVEITGGTGVSYPSQAVANDLTTLITTAGVCNTNNSDGNLTFTLYSPTRATVSSISFLDQYGNTKGSVTSKSTVSANNNPSSELERFIITTTITNTANLDNITETKLYAQIKLSNQDTINSTTTSGVMLYIYPKTVVNNTNNKSYTDAFERIMYSKDAKDAKSFTFQLDFGMSNVMDTTEIDVAKSTLVTVDSISYDRYQLLKDEDYAVTYDSYKNSEGEMIRTATVTIHVGNFEDNDKIKITQNTQPLLITLNNGEVLDNKVTIRMIETATLLEGPISWSITERSLKETTKTTVTNTDNSTTVVETEVITFEIPLKIFSDKYAVAVSDVTWGGLSVLKSAQISKGEVIIYLSNPKINRLETSSSTTNTLIITFSNGYTIRSGYKLTIINQD